MESATQNSFIGGGKVPHEKNTKTHITRGSKFFEGGLISQYPCFTVQDGSLCPIICVDQITPLTFELIQIIPKETIQSFDSNMDLVCCIPMNKVLTKLTKNILTSLPYISNNVECKSVSRATFIADIEKNLSNHEPIELYSIFKIPHTPLKSLSQKERKT